MEMTTATPRCFTGEFKEVTHREKRREGEIVRGRARELDKDNII